MMMARCWCLQECADNCEETHIVAEHGVPIVSHPELVSAVPSIDGSLLDQRNGRHAAGREKAADDVAGGSRALRVSPDFSLRDESAVFGAGCGDQTSQQKADDVKKLQNVIKDFVKEVLRGVELDVVLEDGSLVCCRCWIDNRLSVLTLRVRDVVRQIGLADIEQICSGKELQSIRTTTPLDQNCATLVMSNDQCVTFKFQDVEAREHFATCMKVLRLATS